MAGRAAFEAIKKVIELAMDSKIDATVTAPINKEAINLAGYRFSGHTEVYAHFTNTKDYAIMLAEGNLRVVHVLTHVPLRKACDLVKRERVLKVIELANKACKKLGIDLPKIGVAGLNPHSGKHGLLGWEEEKEIIPAIEEARKKGIIIIIAMYHDQGHIPLKMVGFN